MDRNLKLPDGHETPGMRLIAPLDVQKLKEDGLWEVFHRVTFERTHEIILLQEDRFHILQWKPVKLEKSYSRPRNPDTGEFCDCDDCKEFFKPGMKDHTKIIWSS